MSFLQSYKFLDRIEPQPYLSFGERLISFQILLSLPSLRNVSKSKKYLSGGISFEFATNVHPAQAGEAISISNASRYFICCISYHRRPYRHRRPPRAALTPRPRALHSGTIPACMAICKFMSISIRSSFSKESGSTNHGSIARVTSFFFMSLVCIAVRIAE